MHIFLLISWYKIYRRHDFYVIIYHFQLLFHHIRFIRENEKSHSNNLKSTESKFVLSFICVFNHILVCDLVADSGSGPDYYQYFYYDKATNKCDWFYYYGYSGNGNRFVDYHTCYSTCVEADVNG